MICGTIHRTLANKTRKDTKTKFYKVMATPMLTYGSETWTITKKDQSRIQSAEMKFLRKVKGCTLEDQIKNSEIRKELNIFCMNDRIENGKTRWKVHIDRMETERLVRQVIDYRPKGERDIGRPRKRWFL